MPERSYRGLLWALALLGLSLDQATKYGVFAWLGGVEGHSWSVFQTADGSGFHLRAQFDKDQAPHVNQGALFGLGKGHKTLANAGFAAVSLAAALAIVVWSLQRNTARDRWLCAALGLILAGTLGNFYDRVVFNGVRDFLHWDFLFDWPVFNVADCCLVCGAGLLLLQAFSGQPAKSGDDQPEAATEAGLVRPAEAAAVQCAGPKA
jgi:lipoprotein signal peptidase